MGEGAATVNKTPRPGTAPGWRKWQLITGATGLVEFIACFLLLSLNQSRGSLDRHLELILVFFAGFLLWAATWAFPRETGKTMPTRVAHAISLAVPFAVFLILVFSPLY